MKPGSGTVARIRAGGFDTGVLLTNSFRGAALLFRGRVKRRVGYARDGRSLLLTEALSPLKNDAGFVPISMVPYYAALTERLGCGVSDARLELGISPLQEQQGRQLLTHYGLEVGRYVAINPGAAFGAAKCWPAGRFAELCRRIGSEFGLRCAILGGSGERALMRSIARDAGGAAVSCDDPPTTLGSMKVLIRDCAALVCNDTGPRHYGLAFGRPTITIFGPTDPAWTETHAACEKKLRVSVPCGPCQLRTCPIDHRCMTMISVETAAAAVQQAL
jgi:heptosyltransferase-2